MKSSGVLRHSFFFFFLLQCLCREICWHGWHLFGCVTFLTHFQLEGWEGGGDRGRGWWDRVLSLQREVVFFHVCENAKRAALYNGGAKGEAVRSASVKDTLGSTSRRTSGWGSFVFLTALHVGMQKSPTWKMNVTKQCMSWPPAHNNSLFYDTFWRKSQGRSFPL